MSSRKNRPTTAVRWWARVLVALVIAYTSPLTAVAQNEVPDSIVMVLDSLYNTMGDRLKAEMDSLPATETPDVQTEAPAIMTKAQRMVRVPRDWSLWKPDPQRALWLALVIPGGGQIYNRKYWKLPLVYGGFVGCVYAMMWNNMMYKDYAQAYLDIMDDDPGTASYNKFLHLGRRIDSTNEERYKQIFKKRKDRYRRQRDLSFFVMVGVYALSVIDAYVDAELSTFDISKDLSMKLRPTVMGNGNNSTVNPLYTTSVGLNCSISF